MRVAKAGHIAMWISIAMSGKCLPMKQKHPICAIMKGYLVSVSLTTLEDAYDSLRNPKKAIWVIPGLRQARILLDKDGSIAALKEFAAKADLGDLADCCQCLCFLESIGLRRRNS